MIKGVIYYKVLLLWTYNEKHFSIYEWLNYCLFNIDILSDDIQCTAANTTIFIRYVVWGKLGSGVLTSRSCYLDSDCSLYQVYAGTNSQSDYIHLKECMLSHVSNWFYLKRIWDLLPLILWNTANCWLVIWSWYEMVFRKRFILRYLAYVNAFPLELALMYLSHFLKTTCF